MVLTIDGDRDLNVSEIDPTWRVSPFWKWKWNSDGQLVNSGTGGSVCFSDDRGWYREIGLIPGYDYGFCTLAHTDEPDELNYLAELLASCDV